MCCLEVKATCFARFLSPSIMCLAATPCLAGSGSEVRVQLSENRGAAWGVTRLARCPCYPAARGGLRLFTGFIPADVRLTVFLSVHMFVFCFILTAKLSVYIPLQSAAPLSLCLTVFRFPTSFHHLLVCISMMASLFSF